MAEVQIVTYDGDTVEAEQRVASVTVYDGGAGLPGAKGDPGDPGAPGQSAYEIAVDSGFAGTELEWLDSLQGVDGDDGESAYDIAAANGFVGTEADWLASLVGEDGAPGTNGRSPEFQKSATHIQWRLVGDTTWLNLVALADLKGDKGDAGDPGADGVDGVDGQDGVDRFLVESGGTYPARPDAEPVIFVGATNPDTLGLMTVGDTWVNTAEADPVDVVTATGLDALVAAEVEDAASQTRAVLSASYVPSVADASDTQLTVTKRLKYQDTAAAKGSVFDIEHFGDGTGHASQQTYGLDIHNYEGARQALVVHQYSAASPAVQIDNTDNKAAIYVQNTDNETLNPGGVGSGDAFYFADHGVARARITGTGTLLLAPRSDAGLHAIDITMPSTGTRSGLVIRQNNPAKAIILVQAAAAEGNVPLEIQGRTEAASLYTTQDGANSVVIDKRGTGAGEALRVINKGTGYSLTIRNASAEVLGVTAAGLIKWTNTANVQTTVGGAGGASALPATPAKYLKVVADNGAIYVIPAYPAS